MELDELPIWETLHQRGCRDLIGLYEQKYAKPMPATCQGVTRPDNAIISHQLLPYLGHIQVLANDLFVTHSPVKFSLQLPQPQLFRTKLRLPQSWISLGIDKCDMEQASAVHPTPITSPLLKNGDNTLKMLLIRVCTSNMNFMRMAFNACHVHTAADANRVCL